jgi:hypothetical protein
VTDVFRAINRGITAAGAVIIGIAIISGIGFAFSGRRTLIAGSWWTWLIALLAWLLSGLLFALYLFVGDACSGIQFISASPGNSFLNFLPCFSHSWSQSQLSQYLQSVYSGISNANTFLQTSCATTANTNGFLCSPVTFSNNLYNYTSGWPTSCATPGVGALNAVNPQQFSATYTSTTCPNSNANSLAVQRAIVSASMTLYNIAPIVQALLQCGPVTAMLNLLNNKCPALTSNARMLSNGMIAASIGLTLGLLALIVAYRYLFAAQLAASAPKSADAVDGTVVVVLAPVQTTGDVESAPDGKIPESPVKEST